MNEIEIRPQSDKIILTGKREIRTQPITVRSENPKVNDTTYKPFKVIHVSEDPG